jgi:hypothetical protein
MWLVMFFWTFSEAVAPRLSGRDLFDDYSIQTAAESVLEAHFPPQESSICAGCGVAKRSFVRLIVDRASSSPAWRENKDVWR